MATAAASAAAGARPAPRQSSAGSSGPGSSCSAPAAPRSPAAASAGASTDVQASSHCRRCVRLSTVPCIYERHLTLPRSYAQLTNLTDETPSLEAHLLALLDAHPPEEVEHAVLAYIEAAADFLGTPELARVRSSLLPAGDQSSQTLTLLLPLDVACILSAGYTGRIGRAQQRRQRTTPPTALVAPQSDVVGTTLLPNLPAGAAHAAFQPVPSAPPTRACPLARRAQAEAGRPGRCGRQARSGRSRAGVRQERATTEHRRSVDSVIGGSCKWRHSGRRSTADADDRRRGLARVGPLPPLPRSDSNPLHADPFACFCPRPNPAAHTVSEVSVGRPQGPPLLSRPLSVLLDIYPEAHHCVLPSLAISVAICIPL
jgi:hypothetical protein